MEQKEATGTVDLRPALTEGEKKKLEMTAILARMVVEEPDRLRRGEKPSLPNGFALEGEKAFSLTKEARKYDMQERRSHCHGTYWTIWLKSPNKESYLAILLRQDHIKVLSKKAVEERYECCHNAKP